MSNNKCIVFKFVANYIDLGLPSGTRWANRNVGATNPEDVGYLFSWGNVGWHTPDDGYVFSAANYQNTVGYTLSGNIPVGAEYDMARANFGAKAKVPTTEQWQELNNNCTSTWTTVNGVEGRLFTSNINGKSIFIPATGYKHDTAYTDTTKCFYWSSTYNAADKAYYLYSAYNSASGISLLHATGEPGMFVRAVM